MDVVFVLFVWVAAALELSGLFCYAPCAADYVGVNSVCWSRCNNPTRVEFVEIIGDAAKISSSLVALDFTGALNTLAQVGG
ncbi:hypothetical protein THRCLA_23470 [Thraustotheca clavata]|uniref:Secreted protein n=1 Tax=Thraustotheca clavata TaxID=74557 RepID=A0A1V9Y491_9STRA|nr:hypothetical protein THRCLA_23470 [Thraustotheca clavata]